MKKILLAAILLLAGAAYAQQKLQHTTNVATISGNSSYINADGLNNNASAIIIVEIDNTARQLNPHAVGVWYNGTQWAVFNQDKANMPAGVTFSIIWANPGSTAFVQKTINGNTVIQHPQLNNNAAAAFYVSQVWNPGGGNGVYNNADIAVVYNKQLQQWEIKNQNGSAVAAGAAFNILVTTPAAASAKIPAAVNKSIISNTPAANPAEDVTSLVKSIKDVNLDFENMYFNWATTGTAFSNQPIKGNTITTNRVFKQMEYAAGGIGGDYWKDILYNIGHKGDNWIGSGEKFNTDTATGTITSKAFTPAGRYCTFLLGGGADISKLYVELQVKKADWEAAWGTPRKSLWGETSDGFVKVNRVTPAFNGEDLYRYYFDLSAELNQQYQNKIIRIKISDEKTTGHINVDDFVFTETLNDYITVIKNGYTVLADADKPVWGFADTHAHWMNHVGLNGLMHGTPGGKLETSDVRKDIPPCDGYNHGLPTPTPGLLTAQVETNAMNRIPERIADPGNAICALTAVPSVLLNVTPGVLHTSVYASAASGSLDPALGVAMVTLMINPAFQTCGHQFIKDVFAKHYNNTVPDVQQGNFIDFPRWNTFFHQLMHISWVRRSYDGGQRLMVVPVGTAKSWEFNSTADGNMKNPKEHVEKAVAALKELVGQNSSWLQIATTPKQAREIILNNKMAIVIALEQAEAGSYFTTAEEEVNWLNSLDIHHVFPIHNINNKNGGAAVFNTALNSYNDLVNRNNPDAPIAAFEVKEGNTGDETKTAVKLGTGFMRQNMRLIPIIGYGTIPFFYLNNVPDSYNYNAFTAHKNKQGLAQHGRNYINALMKKGMIIDIDHMSDAAQDATMQLLKRYHYPMISGHTSFRDLRRDADETGGGDKESRLKTEFTIFNSRAKEINDAGGMFGLMTQQNNIRDAGNGCPAGNTSAGGSSSFLQAYWYAALKTNFEKGIAFGSDFNGFAPQVSPRFGTEAVYYLEGDDKLNRKTDDRLSYATIRRKLAFMQKNGVKYDAGINTWHYHRFPSASFLTMEERDIWEALAIAKSRIIPSEAWQPGGGLSAARTGVQQDKIRNMADGFRWGITRAPEGDYGAFLECPDYVVRDENLNNCMPERKAAYMIIRGENSLPQHMKTQRTMELYNVMKPIYNLWMNFENGPNQPLRRSYAFKGGRDFDFNLDGLAHYGMLPDLMQDMKNLGLKDYQMRPLFLASEQYIQLWEKAVSAKSSVTE